MNDPRELAQRIASAVVVEMNRVWELGIVHRPENKGQEGCANFTPIVAAILAAEMPRWVPVEEKLPEGGQYLVVARNVKGNYSERLFAHLTLVSPHIWSISGVWPDPEWIVTHWQHLPALPSPPREEAP